MSRHRLSHAFGHVSLRIDHSRFLVTPAECLGALTASDEGIEVSLDSELPAGVLGEVRIHREIYRRRNDVGGICRVQPPAVMALSAIGETPRVLHGLGSYFAPKPPLWLDTALVRDDERAAAIAEQLGPSAAIILRGNGAVTVADTIEEASSLAFYLEDAAKLELAILPSRTTGLAALEYTPDEVARRAIKTGNIFERTWRYLCLGDPEW